MTGFRFPSLLRRRWLWALAGFVAAVPAIVLAALYWWLFPNLPQYKDEAAGLLSSATGYTITLDKLDGEWGWARPRFTLEGVRISAGGRPLLHFTRLEGRFGWRSLITLEPRFHELSADTPALTVRRGRDGMFYVGGLRVDPNSRDTAFGDWLIKQGELRMLGATVAWVDDTRDSQPLVLRDVNLRMTNLLSRHVFELDLSPPAHLAKPVRLHGVLHGRSLSSPEAWHGTATLNVPALELAAWRSWLPETYARASGHGSIEAEAGIEHGRLSAGRFKLNLAQLYLESPQLPAPVDLARVAGEMGWMRENGPDGAEAQTIYARGLSIRSRTGIAAGAFDASYRRGDGEHKISATQLPVSELAALLPMLPLEAAWKTQINALEPKGRIGSLELSWRGPLAAPEKFSVDARFTGLGWAAEGSRPGAANLSGMLAGNEEKGVYALTGKQAGFDLPEIFADPLLRFDVLNIRGGWRRQDKNVYAIDIAEAALANADFAASLNGRYQIGGAGPGVADITGRVERAHGPRVERYLPLSVNEDTRAWLRGGVLRGEAKQGSFRLQGDLAKFPFKTQDAGIFRVTGRIQGGQLRYAADYPQIDDIDGELLFDGVRMEIRSDKARIYGAQLHRVKAVIPDLDAAEEQLEVSGEAAGPAQEFIRFVNSSPVTERMDGLTEKMTASGDLRLQMNIKVPLRHSRLTTVAGRLVFDRNTVAPGPDLPRVEQISGTLDFTDQTVTARKIAARILGGPAVLTAGTEGGQVRVRGQGNFTAASLDTWFGKEIAGRLSGQSDWRGELRLARGKTGLRLESNLAGMASRLPAPMEKTADKSTAFVFEQQSLDDGTKTSGVQYGNIATAAWVSAPVPGGLKFQRGEMNFGGKARLPDEPGMQITGAVNDFDLGGWMDILPDGQGGKSPGVSGINLTLGSVDFLGREFHDIAVKGGLKGNLLRVAVTGRGMAGNLTFRRADEGAARISAQFRQFTLPDPLPYAQPGSASSVRLNAAGFPSIDLQVEDLRFGSRPMGRLDVIAHGIPAGLAIEQLNLTHADSVMRMSGTWKDKGLGETRMKVNVDIKDAGQMLGRFGYANALRKGVASVEGEVTWPRSPADFTFDRLDGTLRLNAKNGQFLKIDAGAGKLLGIASLQSLPRRMTLDFRDVFSEGFAFDEFSTTMQLADGTVYTDDFLMKGPAATVKMSGAAKLKDESVRLRVKVIPKLSEGVAVAGALLGGPVAGLGALVVQKVLKDPFEEAISYEYLVDGRWDNPAVTRLARPKSVQEKEPDS